MNRIEKLIKEKCPNGVEYKSIDSVTDLYYGKGNNIPKDGGNYPVYGCYGIVSSTSTYNNEDTPIVGHIGSAGKVCWGAGKHYVTYNGTICKTKDSNILNSRYLYHILLNLHLENYVKGSQPFLSSSDFGSIEIPVPTIEVQEEIVRILDKFGELEAELEARKSQYEFWRDRIFEEEAKNGLTSFSEFATVQRGGNFQKKDYVENGKPCIHYGQIYMNYGLFTDKTISFIDENVFSKQKIAHKNDIIMAVTSENIEDVCKTTAWLGDEDIAVSGHSAIISHNQNSKYLSYFFQSKFFQNQKIKYARGVKVVEFQPDKLNRINIPLPSKEKQEEIVTKLDKMYELINSFIYGIPAEIEARRKQYEYYRNKLLNFEDNNA